MTDKILAVIIGAGAGVITIFLRDFIISNYRDTRTEKKSAKEIFRRYADPLSAAAASLLWRLNEILNNPGRGVYLQADIAQTKFVKYKKLSTVYRICNLLGWIRAFRRELSFLRTMNDQCIEGIKTSLGDLEKALADGAHIELQRLDSLLDLWKHVYPHIEDQMIRAKVAYCLDHRLKEFLHKSKTELASDLSTEQQKDLCKELAKVIADEIDTHTPNDDIIEETRARSIKCISLKEAWLFRDWQAGIGDMMITPAPEGGRYYDIIGYRDLEEKYKDKESKDHFWINRVKEIIDGLDTTVSDEFDVRIGQLNNTIKAVASLFLILVSEDEGKRILFDSTIELANNIINSASN